MVNYFSFKLQLRLDHGSMSSDMLILRSAQLDGALGLKGLGVGAWDTLQGPRCFQMDSIAAVVVLVRRNSCVR